MKKAIFLTMLLLVICFFSFGCTSVDRNKDTNENHDDGRGIQEIAERFGIADYKYIKEIEDGNVFITNSLKDIYEGFAESKDECLLSQLEPIDIFRLFNHAKLIDDYETACALIKIPEEEIDKDEFLLQRKNDDVERQNIKKLFERYKAKEDEVFQVRTNENTAFIIFRGQEQYRLERLESGIWKIGWLALQ